MYFFDKKTEYLIWKMREGQARGVGSVRFVVMDGVCRVEVSVTACGNLQGKYPLYLLSGDIRSLLGELQMQKGKGSFYLKGNTERLGDRAVPYRKVTGLLIDLETEGQLEQRWLPVNAKEPEPSGNTGEPASAESIREPKAAPAEKPQEPASAENIREPEAAPAGKPQEPESVGNIRESETAPGKPPLHPEKWQQLCAIYPIVHPFGDSRGYLSIEPRDFVVLQERYQSMVQNSFLLHGFYHYRHLLLGRQRQGRMLQYYLGVPGFFYDKEKAAALYYGFESFECANAQAKEGDFGYYMKRVQI